MNLQQLKSVIQAANSKIEEERCENGYSHYCSTCGWKIGRPIRLADVILTISEVEEGIGPVDFDRICLELIRLWNWLDDNLNHASPQCQEFLINLLCK